MTIDIDEPTFRAWLKANFSESQLQEIARWGSGAGWHGLTYYSDTTALYDAFEDEVWEALADDAESMGVNVPAFIAGFQIADQIADPATFKNALVWYMAERIAYELADEE